MAFEQAHAQAGWLRTHPLAELVSRCLRLFELVVHRRVLDVEEPFDTGARLDLLGKRRPRLVALGAHLVHLAARVLFELVELRICILGEGFAVERNLAQSGNDSFARLGVLIKVGERVAERFAEVAIVGLEFDDDLDSFCDYRAHRACGARANQFTTDPRRRGERTEALLE